VIRGEVLPDDNDFTVLLMYLRRGWRRFGVGNVEASIYSVKLDIAKT